MDTGMDQQSQSMWLANVRDCRWSPDACTSDGRLSPMAETAIGPWGNFRNLEEFSEEL
jgi:hypothetical protein